MRRLTLWLLRKLFPALLLVGCTQAPLLGPDGGPLQPGGGGHVVIPGGGGGTSEMAIYASGSRIKARVGSTPDGARTFLGWYDTQLQAECYMFPSYKTTDGVVRCLPGLALVAAYYADATCTTRAALGVCTAAPQKYGISYAPTCGSQTVTVHPVADVADAGSYYSRIADGGCGAPTALPAGFLLYSFGPALDPSGFVPMVETVE